MLIQNNFDKNLPILEGCRADGAKILNKFVSPLFIIFYHFRELFIIVYTGNFYSTFSVGANLNFYFVNFGDGTEIGRYIFNFFK